MNAIVVTFSISLPPPILLLLWKVRVTRSLSHWFGMDSQTAAEMATRGEGPTGSLPLTDEMLRTWPSGDLFGLTQNAGMGWDS